VSVDGFAELTLEAATPRRMEAFYSEAVGLRASPRGGPHLARVGGHARLGSGPREKEFGDEGGTHVHFAFSAPGRPRRAPSGSGRDGVRGPERAPGRDRSIYFGDPEGNVVEAWDFFGRGRSSDELADPSGDPS
jgi:catechol-2,3-dioxygenase